MRDQANQGFERQEDNREEVDLLAQFAKMLVNEVYRFSLI
jgi:hypothetical protein